MANPLYCGCYRTWGRQWTAISFFILGRETGRLLWIWCLSPLSFDFCVDWFCGTKFFLRRCYKHIYSPQIGSPWPAKVQMPPKSTSVNSKFHLGWLTRMWVRGFLQKQKWLTAAFTKAHLSLGEPGAHCTARGQLNWMERVLSKWLSWSKPLSFS